MNPYYTWTAVFIDGSELNQFNEDGSENLFKEIEESKEALVQFRLTGEDDSHYEANLLKGEIDCNGKLIKSFASITGEVKLIYSRRNQVRVKIGQGTPLDSRVIHRIGLVDDDEQIIIEVFPGLHMAEKKVEVYQEKKSSKEVSQEDITLEV